MNLLRIDVSRGSWADMHIKTGTSRVHFACSCRRKPLTPSTAVVRAMSNGRADRVELRLHIDPAGFSAKADLAASQNRTAAAFNSFWGNLGHNTRAMTTPTVKPVITPKQLSTIAAKGTGFCVLRATKTKARKIVPNIQKASPGIFEAK